MPSAYDEVLYPPGVHIHTQLDRLATVGRLRGMRPAPIDNCRVLELGCGVGTNLIAMAINWPDSLFLGLDLASKPIQSGQADIKELGPHNIELIEADVLMQTKNGLEKVRCFFRLNDQAESESRVTIFWLQWYSAKSWWQQLVLRTPHLPERNTTNPILAGTDQGTTDFTDYADFILVVASNDAGKSRQ